MSRQINNEERWIAQVNAAFDEVSLPPRPNDNDILAQMRNTDSAESSGSDSRFTFFWRYWNMKTTKRWMIAAAIVLLAASLTGILMPERFSPQQSFAQMVQNVQLIRTAVMNITVTSPGQPPVSMKMSLDNSGKMRQEFEQPHDIMNMVNIFDLSAGKMVCLMPSQKQAVVMDMGQIPPEQLPRNVVDEFRKLPPEAAQWKEKIVEDGRTLLVYEVVQLPGATTELWVDQDTLLPVRSRVQMPSPMGKGNMLMEIKDIQWDVPLPADTFNLTPPPGYNVRQMDMNLANGGPPDVVALLRLWTYFSDGAFPDKLDPMSISFDLQELMRDYLEHAKQQIAKENETTAAPPGEDQLYLDKSDTITGDPQSATERFSFTFKPDSLYPHLKLDIQMTQGRADLRILNPAGQVVQAMGAQQCTIGDCAINDVQAPGEYTVELTTKNAVGQWRLSIFGGPAPAESKVFAKIAHDVLGMDVKTTNQEQAVQIMQKVGGIMGRAGMYLGPYFQKKTFVWTGQGAHLGDDNRIICYWPNEDGKHYHAIDARLNLLSLTVEQLPQTVPNKPDSPTVP
ncbi:MAG: hypothetical protein IT445_19160 [Phycisphaeraceae bacterium]|nr:hypothetical protein [Phycisphaeraceae bacterium]